MGMWESLLIRETGGEDSFPMAIRYESQSRGPIHCHVYLFPSWRERLWERIGLFVKVQLVFKFIVVFMCIIWKMVTSLSSYRGESLI